MASEEPTDIPGPIARLKDLATALGGLDSRWVHLRNEELGGDFFYHSGLPEPLINATTTLYGAGRDFAMGLAADFANVTNPVRFPDISHFIRYFDERIHS